MVHSFSGDIMEPEALPERPLPVDIVITVCDSAASEACPVWNGAPVNVHWGIPDPAADGDFDAAYARLRGRVEAMLELPLEDLDAAGRKRELEQIHVDQT